MKRPPYAQNRNEKRSSGKQSHHLKLQNVGDEEIRKDSGETMQIT